MREFGQDRKYGVPKTAQITDQMLRYASTLMRFNKIWFSENLMCGEGVTVQGMIDKLLTQMSSYKCEVKVNKNDQFSTPKFKWYVDFYGIPLGS